MPQSRKGKSRAAGAPAWLVTFADLMSLLVCFFVLIISYSVPDTEKLKIAAGSIRDAFGITREIVVTGVVELDGNPIHKYAQDLAPRPINDVVGPIPDQGREINYLSAREQYWEDVLEREAEAVGTPEPRTDEAADETFEAVEEEIRQAMQSIPELERLADHLVIDRAPEGLRIQIVDQARMSMFPLGSARMHEPTRKLLREVAAAIEDLPNPVEIAGHTDSRRFPANHAYDNWSLSMDRADATRRALVGAGLDPSRLAEVTGNADTDHMFPDDPQDPRNRRISITLRRTDAATADAEGPSAAGRDRAGIGRAPMNGALAFEFAEARSVAGRPSRQDGGPEEVEGPTEAGDGQRGVDEF